MKRLIIGQIPRDFDQTKDKLLGPFCILGMENIFSDWENYKYEPDVISNETELCNYDDITTDFTNYLLNSIIGSLNDRFEKKHTPSFWKIILYPWLHSLVQFCWERQQRVLNFIYNNKDEEVTVQIIKDNILWNFRDTLSFQKYGILSPLFNEWFFSRIIENIAPTNWEIIEIDKSQDTKMIELLSNISDNEKNHISKIHNLLKLLVHKYIAQKVLINSAFINIYGTNTIEQLLFSFLLLFAKKKKSNNENKSSNLSFEHEAHNKIDWTFDFEKYLWILMPKSISNFKEYREKIPKLKFSKIIVSPDIYFDDFKIKPFLASQKELGVRIVSVQHGGHNYGTAKTCNIMDEIEYSNDAFITWGWKNHEKYDRNFVSLTSPLLSKHSNQHVEMNDSLIAVGTLVRLFNHRIQSNPQPKQQIIYLKNKRIFFDNLDLQIFSRTHYKSYPDLYSMGCIDDLSYIKSYYPNLIEFKGSLHDQMKKCRLLILDHPGTSVNLAMAMNCPMILFWDRESWPLSKQASRFFEDLINEGIFFHSAQDAAKKVNEIWDNVGTWWQQDNIQNARKRWVAQYARTNTQWKKEWIKALWKL